MWLVIKEVGYLLAGSDKGKIKIRGFAGAIQAAYWLTLAFILYVTVPHAVAVLTHYEPGGDTANAVSMALAIELVPTLAFLVAMHFDGLDGWTRTGLIGLALPFVCLSFVIQSEAFDRAGRHGIESWVLALALPYGIVVTSVGVALVTAQVAKNREKISTDIAAAVEAVQAKAKEAAAGVEKRLAAIERDRDRLAGLVAQKDAQLAQPDPALIQVNNEVANLRRELNEERSAATRVQAEAARRIGELEARLEAAQSAARQSVPTGATIVTPQHRLAVVPQPSPVIETGESKEILMYRAAEMRRVGRSDSEIATALGKARGTIIAWLKDVPRPSGQTLTEQRQGEAEQYA